MNLALKKSINFYPLEQGLYHVYDASTSRHFKLGEQEVNWLKLLDGKTPVEVLRGLIPLEYFDKFINTVQRLDLLEGESEGESKKEPFSPLKIKVLNLDPSRFIDNSGNLPVYVRNFLNWCSLPLLVINLLMVALLVPQVENIRETLTFNTFTVFFYFFAILITGIVHEGAHALVAKSFNVKVPQVGMMLFFLHPSFYADVSGINLMSDRKKRIKVLIAGVQGNNLLMFLGLMLTFIPMGETALSYLLFFTAINFVLMFINLIPFVEYDGYYIFQELLGEPRFARNALVSQLTRQNKKIEYTAYFFISQLFQFILIVSMLVLIHDGVLLLWDAPWVDVLFLVLIVIAYPALMAFKIRSAK
ncbi:hypothetical protein SG34_016760 [Thalassomonas viridans]|uniref:Peptidase M50 n=1 Tax=Thalassomonas viridans TaxID=137584 RepID=A0AAF0C7E0_9GAMM|nr:hypothetical protein [Thalassomonas viridans]WDE03075.1 hypothetical protein SG34_016760 [Thalassomonas viridans]